MITDTGKTTPAPWVPFTRAGCDVGGVGTANIELENTSTAASGDITKVFGTGSPEWNEARRRLAARADRLRRHRDPLLAGAVERVRGNANAPPDLLPDEPGGYTGFKALFGAKYVDPAITHGNSACVPDTSGDPITDPVGNCGFPGLRRDAREEHARLRRRDAGVRRPGDLRLHLGRARPARPTLATDSYASSATGPGEIAHLQQLKAYDDAFASFFDNLQHATGSTRDNTLFVITVDEGDHFAGGIGKPQPGAEPRLRPPHVHGPRRLPDEPDRRGRREHEGCCTGGRATSTSTSTTLRRSTSTASPARPTRRCAKLERTSAG